MRWFATLLACAGLASAAQAGPSDAQMLFAVTELSGGDPVAIAAAQEMIAGGAQDSWAGQWLDGDRPVAILFHGLSSADRLAYLDWAEGSDETLAWFQALFRSSGLNWPDDLTARITAEVEAGWKERGDAVGLVYIPLQQHAEAQGHRIMSINSGGDAHAFVVVPVAVAERWQDVKIDDDLWVEHPDWQFAHQLKAAGLTPLHINHPANRARAIPKP